MQNDAEMPNETVSEMPNDMADEMLSETADQSPDVQSVDESSSDSKFEMRPGTMTENISGKNGKSGKKKSAVSKSRSDKSSARKSGSVHAPKGPASELNTQASRASNETDSASRAIADIVSESIESVNMATQVAWEAAHLLFEEGATMPESIEDDHEKNETEQTEVNLDDSFTESIEQMGFAALDSSEQRLDEELSEESFVEGNEFDLAGSGLAVSSESRAETENDPNRDSNRDSNRDFGENSHESTLNDSGDLSEIGSDSDSENDADPQPTEFIEADHLVSIVESLLFSTDKPVSIATIKQMFRGSNVRTKDITRALDILASDYASATRGVTLEEINGGYQLRSKVDNGPYLRRLQKSRPFRLSGPALEVMSIVAYKQPVTKHEIDEIRGVESGHLLRALMERGMVNFGGKSDLPGKPMTYGTTRKFLEIFGLRNLKELPTLSEIDEILPQGIGETEEKEKLSDLTGQLSTELAMSYSEGEDELDAINSDLLAIDTTSEFFEQEKQRERDRRDRDKAQDLREKIVMGDDVEEKDRRWLDRYEAKLLAAEQAAASGTPISIPNEDGDAAPRISNELQELSAHQNGLGNLPKSESEDVSENESVSESVSESTENETEESDDDGIEAFELSADSELMADEESDMLDDLEATVDWDEDLESEIESDSSETGFELNSESQKDPEPEL